MSPNRYLEQPDSLPPPPPPMPPGGSTYERGYNKGHAAGLAEGRSEREALVAELRNLRPNVWHADYCAPGDLDEHCICGLTAAIVRADALLAAHPTPPNSVEDTQRAECDYCGSRKASCMALWPTQRKCCPECTHSSGPTP